MINNVGHTLNVKDPFCKIEDWKEVFQLNVFTAIDLVNHFIKDMKKIGAE